MHAESTFRKSQVTLSQTKFDHVVQKLPQNIMVFVRGLIMNSAASSSTPYEDLKAKLVSSYTLLPWQRINKLIHHPALGDRLPTVLMDTMLALMPDDIFDAFVVSASSVIFDALVVSASSVIFDVLVFSASSVIFDAIVVSACLITGQSTN